MKARSSHPLARVTANIWIRQSNILPTANVRLVLKLQLAIYS